MFVYAMNNPLANSDVLGLCTPGDTDRVMTNVRHEPGKYTGEANPYMTSIDGTAYHVCRCEQKGLKVVVDVIIRKCNSDCEWEAVGAIYDFVFKTLPDKWVTKWCRPRTDQDQGLGWILGMDYQCTERCKSLSR